MRQLQRATAIVAVLAVLIGMAGGASGQALEKVGGWYYGWAEAVASDPDRPLLFVGDAGGILLVDVSDKNHPTIKSRLATPGAVKGLFYKDPYLYVADGPKGGLRIVDVEDPSSPAELGFWDTPGTALDVMVLENENIAYIADGPAGLYMIDVSNPLSPSELGSFSTVKANAVFVETRSGAEIQRRAYIADGEAGLRIFDVTTPDNPSDLGGSNIPNNAMDVLVYGDIAYLADGDGGFRILDISNLDTIIEISNLGVAAPALNIQVEGSDIYIARGPAGFSIINAAHLYDPRISSTENTAGTASDLIVKGYYAYVANGENGLAVYDVSDRNDPILESRLQSPFNASDISVVGNVAYLTDEANAFHLLDVNDPAAPNPMGRYDMSAEGRAAAIYGAAAYVIEGPNTLRILNIGDPTEPVSMGVFANLTDGKDVFANQTHAYVADGAGGLKIIDASSPGSPTLTEELYTEGVASGIHVSGGHAFIANGENGLFIADVRDPGSPSEASSLDDPDMTAAAVAVSGSYAYVADLTGKGVLVIDVDDPTNPLHVETISDGYDVVDVAISGDFLHISLADGAVHTYYIRKPTAPIEMDGYATAGSGGTLEVAGDYIYIANGSRGLEVLRFTPPESPDAPIVPPGAEIEKAARWFVAEWEAVPQADGYELDVAYDSDFQQYVSGFNATPVAADTTTVVGLEPDTMYHYRVRAISNGIAGADSNTVSIRTQTEFAQIGAWTNASFDAIALNPYESILFMGSGAEIYVFDVSDPTDPSKIGQLSTPGSVRDLFYEYGYLYVADDWKGLRIYDLDEPWSPEIGFFPEDGAQREVAAVFPSYIAPGIDAAFIVGGVNEGVAVLSIEDKTSPQFLFDYPLVYASDVVSDPLSKLTFVTDSFGLKIFGMFNDSYFGLVGAVEIPGAALAVDLSDHFAYVAGSDGVYAIDIQDPSKPRIVDYYETSRKVEAIHVSSAGYAYFLDGDTLYIWKNADEYVMTYADSATKPEKDIAQHGLSGSAHNFSIWGTYVFVADGDQGLKVLQYAYELSPPEINPDPYYVSEDAIAIEWRPVPGAGEYRVEISDNHFQTVFFTDTVIGSWYRFNDGLKPSTEYHIRVTTKMAGVESAPEELDPIRTKSSQEPGDLDNDGLVTLSDAIVALKVLVGITPDAFHPEYIDSGVDIDGNDRAGLAEALFSLQVAAGLR